MAKKNHQMRNSIKSFFESHADPEKQEKLKATRKDMEEKKEQLLNIVKNEEDTDESKRAPLAELIEDFHKHYESLYAHYDHLTGELKNKVHKRHHENENSSSSSDSDSDSDSDHSPKAKNGIMDDKNLKAIDGLQQEVEAANLEITLLKNKLEAVCNEKETLESNHGALISKLESTEKTVEDLRVENKTLNSEKSNLLAEKDDLNSKLESSVKIEIDLKQQIADLIKDKDTLATETKDADNLKADVEKLQGQKQSLELELETIKQDFAALKLELEVNENESDSKTGSPKVNDFTPEVDKLHGEKSQLEEQVKELEDALNHKGKQYEQLEEQLQETKVDLEAAKSEIEKLTQELNMTTGSKDESVTELERTIAELKKGIEVFEDEAKTALAKTRTIEFQLLMAHQKLRITEQLLAEKEVDKKIAETKFQEESKLLRERASRLSLALAANNKAYRGMIMNISENLNSSLVETETITKKYEEDNEKFSGRIRSMSEEIQILKHMIEKNTDRKNLEEQLRNLSQELQNEREHGLMVKEKLSKLEVEAEKDKGEKEKLFAELTELKKTTEEQIMILEDEKREVIRQLCLWSDSRQSRYDELKSVFAKSGSQRIK